MTVYAYICVYVPVFSTTLVPLAMLVPLAKPAPLASQASVKHNKNNNKIHYFE